MKYALLVILAVATTACQNRVERPRAAGLISDPQPVDYADNAVLMRETVLAARSDALIRLPDLGSRREDEWLSACAANLEDYIAHRDYDRARKTIALMQEHLANSLAQDERITETTNAN